MGSLSTGFRALKGVASLFLPHYFCMFSVSSQDKCPSACFIVEGILLPVVFQLQMLSLPWQGRLLLDKAMGSPGCSGVRSCCWSSGPGLDLKGKISCREGGVTCGVQLLLCPWCPVCLFWMSRLQHSLWEEHLGCSGNRTHPAFVC